MEKGPPRPGLPVKPIATLFVMMFANAIVTTTPFPFLPFMVREFGFEPEDVGTQVQSFARGLTVLTDLLCDCLGSRPG